MDMRSDALCAAAEIILEMEKIGKWESAYESGGDGGRGSEPSECSERHTGRVELGVDMRGIDQDSLDRMERAFKAAVRESCKKRGVEYVAEKINSIPPISMSESVEDGLEQAAKRLGISSRRMPSGAGHDAMSLRRFVIPVWYLFRAGAVCHTIRRSMRRLRVSVMGRG